MSAEPSGRRLGALALVAVALFATLLARLYFLQVMSPKDYTEVAAQNRTRLIYTEAPRGQIYDVNGRLLAGRRESLVVTLDWTELQDLEADERVLIYGSVATELNSRGLKMKVSDLRREYDRATDGSLKPVVVAEDVGFEAWVAIEELGLPGFAVERAWVRTYPYGPIGANILGYVGEVVSGEKAEEFTLSNPEKRYEAGDEIGLAGIEELFEGILRGVPELKEVEINASNRVIRDRQVLQQAVPGQDIFLAIDIDKQYIAEEILKEELALADARPACKDCLLPHNAKAGALVAIDVRDGSVAALATYPSYDPASLVYGISESQADYLLNNPDKPLFNRPIEGLYAPGSTFKPITAYAALVSGARAADYWWEDEGSYRLETCEADAAGCVFQNAGGAVLGPVNMELAISRSSDTYFYSLGETFWGRREEFGETAIQDTAKLFGLGSQSGVELAREQSGRVPTPEWKRSLNENYPDSYPDPRWYTGNNVILAIGQGDLLVTPLQLANVYAMIATGGRRYQPRLVDRTVDGETFETVVEFTPRLEADEQLDSAAMATIRTGLRGVPQARGTAEDAFATFDLANYPIAGKTGTAQVNGKADYSLFAGYGPADSPQYAIAGVLEEAGFGGDAAAPAVRRLFEYLLGIKEVPEAPLADGDRLSIDRPLIGEGNVVVEDTQEPVASADPSPIQPSPEASPTTVPPTTAPSTTKAPTTAAPTTKAPTTKPPTTVPPTTVPPVEETVPPSTTAGGDTEGALGQQKNLGRLVRFA